MSAIPAPVRFWAKAHKTDTCWLWRGYVMKNGYGTFGIRKGRNMLAHRFAYEDRVGPIAEGGVIDHLCRVRNCVNPAHMEVVTQRENLLRGEGRTMRIHRSGTCSRGHGPEHWRPRTRSEGGWECRACLRIRRAEARQPKH